MLASLLILALATPPVADDPKPGLDDFQGTWKAVAMENDGEETTGEEVGKQLLKVKGNRFEMTGGDETYRGSLAVDPIPDPHTIDATYEDEDENELGVILGIYKMNGRRLTICWDQEGEDRPAEFKTRKDTTLRLMVFEKQD